MEPFALQSSAPGLIRPTINLQSDLGAVLREGRVMSGEVLQTLDGETLLIGVGSHRVPARTRVRMQQGYKFLFQVERDGETVVLRVLGEGEDGESVLLRTLRQVMGQDQPVGELLQRLAEALRASSAEAPAPTAAGKLLGELPAHLFEPGSLASDLLARLGGGGLAYEARLAEVALASLPGARLQALATELRATLLGELLRDVPPESASTLDAALRSALVGLFGGESEVESGLRHWLGGTSADDAEPLPRDLGALLALALGRMKLGSDRAVVLGNLHRAELASLGRGLQQLLLRALLALPAPAPASARIVPADLAWAATDLKGQLLRALTALPDGPAREAVARTLAGLEAEQLLNLARGQSHEPLHWSLPLPDGDRWTTAHLFFRRAGDEEARHSACAAGTHRLTIAVDFAHTGPVRADLVAGSGSLAMRVVATRRDVVDTLSQHLGELEQRLASEGRRVNLVVALARAGEMRVDAGAAHDIRYLRDHHLMDANG